MSQKPNIPKYPIVVFIDYTDNGDASSPQTLSPYKDKQFFSRGFSSGFRKLPR